MAANFHPRIADETKRVLQDNKWSVRQAEKETGIGFATVQNMSMGRRPSAELLCAWARAIDEDELKWLRWAGYDILSGVEDTAAYLTRLEEEEAVPDGLREMIPLYEGLNSVERKLAARTIKAMLEAIAAGREGEVGLEGDGE